MNTGEQKARTVLFIDDDMHRQSSLVQFLQMNGYDIDESSQVALGLTKLTDNPSKYCCVIIDVMMPPDDLGSDLTDFGRRTGLVALGKCREIAPSVPVVVLSVVRKPAVEREASELGAVAFLHKPCRPSVVLQTLREVTN